MAPLPLRCPTPPVLSSNGSTQSLLTPAEAPGASGYLRAGWEQNGIRSLTGVNWRVQLLPHPPNLKRALHSSLRDLFRPPQSQQIAGLARSQAPSLETGSRQSWLLELLVNKSIHQPGFSSPLPHEAASTGFMRPPNLIQTNAAFHSQIKGAAV